MDVARIRELIELMKENDLSEVRIVDGETRLLLRRGQAMAPVPIVPAAPAPAAAPAAGPAKGEAEDHGLVPISSPMVGTFYAAPAPDAEPYVKVGDRVNPGTVVCIVEAMKVMNEIKAEVSGTVAKIVARNASPVEYGQPLIMVRPD